MNPLCLKITNDECDINNSLDAYTLKVSDMKFGDVNLRRFPHRWVSMHKGAEGFHPGVHVVCTEPANHLPIVYANEGGDSLLLRMTAENTQLAHALTELESRIRDALPADERSMLQPILRVPETPGYDCSISAKVKYTDVHDESTGELTRGNTVQKCVLKVQRLNYYMSKIYPSVQLVCCYVTEGCAHGQQTGGQCSKDYYGMMDMSNNNSEEVY